MTNTATEITEAELDDISAGHERFSWDNKGAGLYAENGTGPLASEIEAPHETPAINGGLDRDIIRRVARDRG